MSAFLRKLVVFAAAIVIATLGLGVGSALADTPPTIINTTDPTVGDSPQLGDMLVESPATWTSPPTGTTTATWSDCTLSGVCTPIVGAPTVPGFGTYTVQSSDVGFTIEVTDTPALGNTDSPLTSAATLPVGPPVNTAAPTIAGTAQVGQALTETSGTWVGDSLGVSTTWQRCFGAACTPISPTPGAIYTLTGADAGATIKIKEVASNNGTATATALSTPTATVTGPSTVSLGTVPAAPITNQTTTVTATVTSASALAPPAGTMTFQAGGQTISGCGAVPVSTLSQSASVSVSCQAQFSSAASPQMLTATFNPAPSSGSTSSTSPPLNLQIGPDPTTTALDVSNPVVFAGKTATYTATVTPSLSGPFRPTGKVLFLDGGNPISGCPATPVKIVQGAATAQCTVRYPQTGTHSIIAFFLGDGGFGESATTQQTVTVEHLPPKIVGTITAKMRWMFRFTPKYTQALGLLLRRAAVNTAVLITCRGKGCPWRQHTVHVVKVKVCSKSGGRRHCALQPPPSLNLATSLHKSRLRVGAVLTIELSRNKFIGKGYVFSIRRAKGPKYRIGCVSPGSTKVTKRCT